MLSHGYDCLVQSVAPYPLTLRIVNRVIPRSRLHACGTELLPFFFFILNSIAFFSLHLLLLKSQTPAGLRSGNL